MERTVKADIDEAIKNAATYEDCIDLLRAKGYEIKGETIVTEGGSGGENSHKFISFRPLDRSVLSVEAQSLWVLNIPKNG